MKTNKQHLLLICLALSALCLLLDQWSKHLAAASLKGKPPISLIPGFLELTYVENTGVAFGMLHRTSIFPLILGIILLCALLGFCVHLRKILDRISVCFLSLLLSGAVGNLVDRIRLGFVVDFIYIRLIRFPVFNIADCCVVLGTFGLGFWLWTKGDGK